MNTVERQSAAVKVLIVMEPEFVHAENCPGKKNPEKCNCYLFRNAKARALALDSAGLLCALAKNYNRED